MNSDNDLQEKMLDKNGVDDEPLNEAISLHNSGRQKFDLNSAIIAAGDYGKYHILNLLFLSLVWVIIPSIPVMLPYFRMMPQFMCQNEDNTLRQCTIQEICDNTIVKINPNSPLKTWATDFNMYCDKSIYFGVLGSLYFVGILFGNFFIAKFTDSYGRKPVLIFYLVFYLLISLLTIFAWTYYVFFLVSFSVGVIYSGTSMCAFILNFESSSKERKSTFSTILSTTYGMGAIAHILIFYYFENWIVTVSISSALTIIVLIFTFHLQESPEFLLMKKRYSEMIKVLKYIANMNSRTKELDEYLDSTDIKQLEREKHYRKDKEEVVYGIIEILFLPEQRWLLVVMALNWFVMTMVFYGINFNVSNFGTNPYLTGILVYLSESAAQMLCLYIIINYGFRITLCCCYVMSAISLIIINIISAKFHWLIEFTLIFMAKFGISGVNICNYIFTADIFPTMIRVAAMSFCSLMARFGGISGTIIIEVTNSSMLIFGVCSFITAIVLHRIERIKDHDSKNKQFK